MRNTQNTKEKSFFIFKTLPPNLWKTMEAHDQHNHHRRRYLSISDTPPNNRSKTIGVLIAIFLFLAITYLILNSIWQCFLRRFIQPVPPTRSRSSSSHGGRGPARMAHLQAIPVLLIHEHEKEELCSVCLEEYMEGEEVRVLPQCKHLFHRACIDEWLLERSSFCPVCRARVIPGRLNFDKNACMQRNSNANANANAIQRVEMYQGFNIMSHAHYLP